MSTWAIHTFYECNNKLQQKICSIFNECTDMVEGKQWYNGDHMIFVQKGKAALAFTSEKMPELMATITHSKKDTPDIIDTAKLFELAKALNEVIISL